MRTPISQPPYRCNPKYREFLQGEIKRMESQGLIRKSASPWALTVVIVNRKEGENRLCIDYRKLNAITKADAYPLPRIDDMLESFSNATWFTTLDLASGYWQVAMDPADIEKTAFITPFGLYEFLVMPFGLAYTPGTFQRLMNRILQEYLGKFVAVYLDDVIIYSKGTLEQHLDHLRQVFETLRRANLKIKLKKYYFCLGNIHFLEHVVGREGIHVSGTGLGDVLLQIREDGKEHVVAYASRSLNKAECNYLITDQECLAIVWAIKHFQHYLGLKSFTIVTDHSALKWLKISKIPKGRHARWVMDLQQYDFNIKHRAGKANANADALSRISTPVHEEYDADSEDDYTDRPAQKAIDLLNHCDYLLYDMQSYIEE
ncbi:uncharacterized protein LOC114968091 [Rhizophagus irregularis DAOM 181602=DAOM 197198]|nr:uncharacterized protein LOC114968091 [Rhizophagus irregularis DAOM 181602=DAOM 197198]